jgi:hypothetical protein
VDVNQRSIGPLTLMMYLKASGLEPHVPETNAAALALARCSRATQPHIYMDIEFADGRFLFDQTLPLPSGSYDWTTAGCVLQ